MAREGTDQNDGDHGNGTMSIFVNGVHLVQLNTAACPECFIPSEVTFVFAISTPGVDMAKDESDVGRDEALRGPMQ